MNKPERVVAWTGRLPERPCSLGDSMVRHVFMRLMHWIQGRTTPCEHYFHASAAYWMTEKNDGFAVQTGGKVLAPKPAPGKMVVHYIFCGFCDPANEVKKRMKLLNGNVKLVVGSPSKWHSNAKTFYNLINTHASPARLMVLGRTEMNCGKKGRPPTMVPEYTRVNEEMNRLVNIRRAAAGSFTRSSLVHSLDSRRLSTCHSCIRSTQDVSPRVTRAFARLKQAA